MNKLTTEQRTQIVHMMVEGMSIRSICRVTGRSKGAILRLLAELGDVCAEYHDEHVRGLACERVQCDEIWQFVGCKEKQAKLGKHGEGDVWTWTAIDADTKLIVTWAVGGRDAGTAWEFMNDLSGRVINRMQLTTDGYGAYLEAVIDNFGSMVDYGQLVKLYGDDPRNKNKPAHVKYSPSQCVGCKPYRRIGHPDLAHISTSYVERHNLTMRMHMRRFTRLTNAFSKKVENHCHAQALFFMYYNFCKAHKSLSGATPAMAAGLVDSFWEVSDIVGLLEAKEQTEIEAGSLKRGTYRPRISK